MQLPAAQYPSTQPTIDEFVQRLAELVVRFGANVQPGQIVALSSEPGKERLARAVAEEAYKAGARFVDLNVFDIYVKRARARYADPKTLTFVPPWYGQRVHHLADFGAAQIALTGPVAPHAMDGVDPALAARDMLPHLRESSELVNQRKTNWSAIPSPTVEWARLVHPELDDVAALERLWEEIAHICRLDEPDPVAAWRQRLQRLVAIAQKLDALELDQLRFHGPGTDLSVGLLPRVHWQCAQLETQRGIVHTPNLPTEEVFATPDPERTEGVVRSTKPLFTSGRLVTGLEVTFENGSAVAINADQGAELMRGLTQRDAGAARLGEVALVDRESRIGKLETVFYDTLLDENAASHIAFGQGLAFGVASQDVERINQSEIHIDFMIGSNEVTVNGITSSGREVALLRDGAWQI
jgi:aminopeptidase